MAGVFFAFSAFVMDGLSRLPAQQSIAAMQFINAAAFNPWFATAFCGTTAVCVLLGRRFIIYVAQTRWYLPSCRQPALSRRRDSSDTPIQPTVERRVSGGRREEPRCCQPVGRLFHQLDGLESRANTRRTCGRGIAHHCPPLATRLGCAVIARKAEFWLWARIDWISCSRRMLMREEVRGGEG
jgi:hypothetical protein